MHLTKRGDTYHVWFSVGGRKTSRSTGKKNLRAAEARARQIIAAARDKRFDVLEAIKARKTSPSIAELMACYSAIATCRKNSKTSNLAAARLFCKVSLGGRSPENCQLSEMTAAALAQFRKSTVAKGRNPDSGDTTARSTLRRLRSLFSTHLLPSYPPAIREAIPGILAGWPKQAKKAPHSDFRPIPWPTLRAIYRDAIKLQRSHPAAWRFFLLMARCGLSNREAHHARGYWLRSGSIHIPSSDLTFAPKSKNRIRSVPIRPHRYQRWFAQFESETTRICTNSLWLQRSILAPMLRKHLPDRQKGLYELRKHAGSMVATRDGIYAAAKFLGDRVETAERFYLSLLRPLKPL